MRGRSGFTTLFFACVVALGCSSKSADPAVDSMAGNPATGTGGSSSSSGTGGSSSSSGTGGSSSSSGTGGSSSSSGTGGSSSSSGTGGSSSSSGTGGSVDPQEVLDPSVDWTALTLVYDTMYSAYDGVHTFQVPVYVDGVTTDVSDWSSIPSGAVSFDPDPDSGGVILTVIADVPEITIAARSGDIGGTAPLYITSATSEQWETGNARYNNGVEYDIPVSDPADFLASISDPNWTPPEVPAGIACNNCHTTGAKYFEVQHTPMQIAYYSDDDLRIILIQGKKPPGAMFRVIPDMFGSQTNEELYASFHTWDATEEEIAGLIVYLRALTPEGQGDIKLPDGTYVALPTN